MPDPVTHLADRDGARRNTRMRFAQWGQEPDLRSEHDLRRPQRADGHGRRARKIERTFGQSPFALARGDRFERSLFYNDGERLLEELMKKDVLTPGASDLRLRMNGGIIIV
jgi:hypothetical protein